MEIVIHGGWKVNFNHNLEAFEDTHIEGACRLIDFSLESTHGAYIHFISSLVHLTDRLMKTQDSLAKIVV